MFEPAADLVARWGWIAGAIVYVAAVVVVFVRVSCTVVVDARRLSADRRARLDAAVRTDHAVSALPDVSCGNPRLRRSKEQ